jgi:ethanolamine utilization protein EutP (predicted NTPase)
MTNAPEKIWVHYEAETDDATWSEYPEYEAFEDSSHYGEYTRTDIADARIAELEAALTRQGDNMAFVLNHMDTRKWYDSFAWELAEDRTALKAKP